MAGQELGAPRRQAGPALEHGHQPLPLAEGGIQGRKIGDLERHHHDPYGTSGDVEGEVLRAARMDSSDGEQGPQRLEKPVRQIVRGRQEHEAEPDE